MYMYVCMYIHTYITNIVLLSAKFQRSISQPARYTEKQSVCTIQKLNICVIIINYFTKVNATFVSKINLQLWRLYEKYINYINLLFVMRFAPIVIIVLQYNCF